MRKLTDGAARAKTILERDNAPLSEECERVVKRDLERTLSGYFDLCGEVSFKITRGENYAITIRAEASQIKPFGVIRV